MISQTHNIGLNLDRVVYANGYTREGANDPHLGRRLFLIFDTGRELTLHGFNASNIANLLGIDSFPLFSSA